MIFPERKPYECSRCRRWWIPGDLACAAMHQPGDCCHYSDTECPAPEPPSPPSVTDTLA